jgi:NADP-dependent 3-hydroxy acid dehydrogenase YdfG
MPEEQSQQPGSSVRQPYKPYSIQDKVVLITGASSGIGEACAWRFADAGCKLIILARRADRLEALKRDIQQTYPTVSVHSIILDVRDTEQLVRLPETLPAEFRDVDILVNNAGLALGTYTTDDVDIEDAIQMINTNITSVVALTKVVSASMKKRNSGHIINISSVAAHESYKQGGVYCGTKHAVDALTVAARHDFVDTDIRVTAISPGAVKTEFSVVRYKGDEDKADQVYEGFHPLTAADIADNVLYAATRPPHVQVTEINVLATYQCSAKGLARVLKQ